jgi:hypothetical protein
VTAIGQTFRTSVGPQLARLEPVAAATPASVATRPRERLRDRPTMVKKLFVRNGTESLPETAMDTGRQNDYK